jgi:2-keto-4-pentenoate hydratase
MSLPMTLHDYDRYAPGMKIQLDGYRQALAAGMPRRGWKVGINVPEVLEQLKLVHSGVGWLDGNQVLANAAEVEVPEGADLKIEPELAIHVSSPVDPDSQNDAAHQRILGVSPAFEIVNYAKPKDGFDTIVGHSMFHHGCVLGAMAPLDSLAEMGTRWPKFTIAGDTCPSPRNDLVPEDLAALVGFVARFLAAFGESLEANDLILSGSYTATAVDLPIGAEVGADFGPLGSLSVKAIAAR